MNSIESILLSYLLNSLWQVPVLAGAAWMVSRMLRPFGASAEHRVWVSSLVLQVSLPGFSILPWVWLQAFVEWITHPGSEAGAHVTVIHGAATTVGRLHAHGWFLAVVSSAYAAATFYFFARFIWRAHKLSVLRCEAVELELDGKAAVYWSQALTHFGIRHAAIAVSSRIFGPVTMGIRSSLVLLPLSMAYDLPAEDINTIIAHEFAHIERNDFLKNLFYEWIALPISFHPLYWFTREQIIETREMICDEVAAGSSGKNEYARSLLRLASMLMTGTSARAPHAIGIFDANELERRLIKLTEKRKYPAGRHRLAIGAFCSVIGVAACASALALGTHVEAAEAINDHGAEKHPAKVAVSAAVMAGNKISGSNPVYPQSAKKAKIQGKVVLGAIIGRDGDIERLDVVSGPKELQASALDAVRDWTYKPYLLNGDPIEVETTINVIYSLGAG